MTDTRKPLSSYLPAAFTLLLVATLTGCESTGSSSRRDGDDSAAASATGGSQDMTDNDSDYEIGGGSDSFSGSMFSSGGVVMNSLSNNPLTSGAIPRSKAVNFAMSVRDNEKASETTRLSGLSAARLGGVDFHEVLDHARPIMSTQIAKSKLILPELAQLEIGLAAIQGRHYARAKIYLDPLLGSTRNPLIKAAIHNAYGVMALQTQQTSQAAKSFKTALKTSSRFTPALMNMGMLALKYGHYSEAQSYLAKLQDHWYAQSALITSDRQFAKNSRVSSLCSQLTRQKSSHKMILFNCGLFYFENLGNKEKARSLIEKATQQAGGESSWDEGAFQIMEKLQ